MKRKDVLELANEVLLPAWRTERERQEVFENWAKGIHVKPYKPREANAEYEALLEKSPVPLIQLVVRILKQDTELVDYTPGVDGLHDPLWAIWQANRMATRQKRLYQAAFRGGLSYAMLLPGDPVPVIKIFSAKNAIALYQDPEADEWPTSALYVEQASDKKRHFVVVDEEKTYRIEGEGDGQKLVWIEEAKHDLDGYAPMIRYTGEVDDEGTVTGEVEPLIPIQASIDQIKFDTLLTESFNSWKIRYITGMAKPVTKEETDQQKLVLERDRLLLIENPESKAGTLDGTELSGYISARDAAKRDLASVAQISHKAVLGSQSNNSDGAEAQAAEEASTQRKLHDYAVSFGESHGQLFRGLGRMAGIDGAWEDYNGVCDFRDSQIRSLSQIADALGKIAGGLGVPVEGLWPMIPNVTPAQIKFWKKLRTDPDAALADDSADDGDDSGI